VQRQQYCNHQASRRKSQCCSQGLVAMPEQEENVKEGSRGAAEQVSLVELQENVKEGSKELRNI